MTKKNKRNEKKPPQWDGSIAQLTESGLSIKEVYTPDDLPADRREGIGIPGAYPFTRGVYKTMYRGRLWTMRQYAGFGTAAESNDRYRFLLSQGQTGLSVAFDLPTQLGYDSDDPRVEDEVGTVGVAIDTLADMEVLFQDIPLDQVSTNFTINSTAAIILAMYYALAEKRGIEARQLRGTVQNDMIKEFLARKSYIFPVEPSLRIVTDIIEFCIERLPSFNPISVAGYHIREAGADVVQELALTLKAGMTYVEGVLSRGIPVDEFARQLSFHFTSGQEFFEEITKYRAARKMWAKIMRDRFHASKTESQLLRVFAGGNGVTLTGQEPLNNIIRGTLQCLVGVLGGAQAIHVPAYDEAFAIPTEESARIGLRTQQIVAYESGIPRTADPLGGSYYIESLTDELQKKAWALMEDLDRRGGLVPCIKSGYIQKLIEDRAFEREKQIQSGQKPVVGVNCFASQKTESIHLSEIDPRICERQKKGLGEIKSQRDQGSVRKALDRLKEAALHGENLMPSVVEAVKNYATVGEIAQQMREVFGEFKETGTA
jgi:methylmalonyl-CoA mutase N-terminal domain/subunit